MLRGGSCRSLPLRRQGAEEEAIALASRRTAATPLPLRRPARNLHFPSPPAPRGEMPKAEGGAAAPATHRIALSTLPPEETCA